MDDSAGHSAYVRLAMAANFSLVVESAERNAHIFAVECVGNRLAQRRFADSGRSVKAQNRSLHIATKFQHGELFKNAVFHFVQTVMVFVQLLFGIVQIEIVFSTVVPWEVEQSFQVGILHGVVGRLRLKSFQFVQFFFESSFDAFAPVLFLCAVVEFVDIVFVGVAEIVLNRTNLLLQEVGALLLGDVFLCFRLNVGFDFDKLSLAIEVRVECVSTLLNRRLFEQLLLVVGRKRGVGAEIIYQLFAVVDVLYCKNQLGGLVAQIVEHIDGNVFDCRNQDFKLLVAVLWLFVAESAYLSLQEWFALGD